MRSPAKTAHQSAPAPRKRNARGQGALLREEIVGAAIRLVDAVGADAVTLRAVAREAGISAPSIYDHFDDVERILGAVVAQLFVELAADVDAAQEGVADPVRRLQAGCDAYLRYAVLHPRRYELLFRRERSPESELGEEEKAIGEAAFGTLVAGIEACVQAGRSVSTDAYADAVALWSGLHGYSSLRSTHEGFPWPQDDDTPARLVHNLARIVSD
jgi:AcrR family transcriptional regulator